jgi:hypothetical protein
MPRTRRAPDKVDARLDQLIRDALEVAAGGQDVTFAQRWLELVSAACEDLRRLRTGDAAAPRDAAGWDPASPCAGGLPPDREP